MTVGYEFKEVILGLREVPLPNLSDKFYGTTFP